MPPTTPTDLGAVVNRLAVATLLAASSASFDWVRWGQGNSSMRNPLVRATMATAAVEAGERSGVMALVLDTRGMTALVRYPCGRAHKNSLQSAVSSKERRNVHHGVPPPAPTTKKMTTRGYDHCCWRRNTR